MVWCTASSAAIRPVAVTMVVLLATASIAAGFIPALRASRINPIGALRHE